MKVLRNPALWGAGALVILTISALVAAFVYANPPGQKIVTFYTLDAASVHPGDQVRIAGIRVGKVKDLSLESNQVRVRALVDGAAFVGDQSQVEVRMLTVVGGYYVSISSLGDSALGAKPIQLERVTMPYNLMRTMTDSTKITENVKPKPISESLNQLQAGLGGSNEKTISAIIEAGNSVMTTVEKQRGQITAILNLTDEYLHTMNNNRELLRTLVRKVSLMEQTFVLYVEGFNNSLSGIGDVIDTLEPVDALYLDHREKFLTMVRDFQIKARFWAERSGVVIRALRLGRNKIERVLDAQNAPPELLATDLCMPVPGSAC